MVGIGYSSIRSQSFMPSLSSSSSCQAVGPSGPTGTSVLPWCPWSHLAPERILSCSGPWLFIHEPKSLLALLVWFLPYLHNWDRHGVESPARIYLTPALELPSLSLTSGHSAGPTCQSLTDGLGSLVPQQHSCWRLNHSQHSGTEEGQLL